MFLLRYRLILYLEVDAGLDEQQLMAPSVMESFIARRIFTGEGTKSTTSCSSGHRTLRRIEYAGDFRIGQEASWWRRDRRQWLNEEVVEKAIGRQVFRTLITSIAVNTRTS